MTYSIEWADPPPPKGGSLLRKEQRAFAEELKARPGQWAIYPSTRSSVAVRALASRISNGRLTAFGKGFEAVTRHGVIYVRFVGGQE